MTTQDNDAAGRGMSRAGAMQLGAILAGILVMIFFGRSVQSVSAEQDDFEIGAPEVPSVVVMHPRATEAALKTSVTGVVTVVNAIALNPKAAGDVVSVSPNLRSGGSFSAGETLLTIDRQEYEIALEAARAGLRYAEARRRKEELRGEFQTAEFRRENPDAEVPGHIARVAHIAREEATIEVARTAVEKAELALSRTEYSLPFDGRIVAANVAVGQFLSPGMRVGEVFTRDGVQVEAQISVEQLGGLEPIIGRAAQVTVDGRTLGAVVDRVSAVVNPQSRLATLYLAFARNVRLGAIPRPGTFALVTLEGSPVDGVFLLPAAAEQVGGRIWVVNEIGVIEAVEPHGIGHTPEGWLVEEFDPKDGVVIEGVPGARPGVRVTASDEAPSGS